VWTPEDHGGSDGAVPWKPEHGELPCGGNQDQGLPGSGVDDGAGSRRLQVRVRWWGNTEYKGWKARWKEEAMRQMEEELREGSTEDDYDGGTRDQNDRL